MPAADLPVACVLKTRRVTAVIRGNVRTKTGVKTENVLFPEKIGHCYECTGKCRKGLLGKIKPYAFTEFARRYGEDYLLDCLERNEKNGVIYHRDGINGDYDDFDEVEPLIEYIRTGYKQDNGGT